VRRILALSTDKAVNPIILYGATKLCAEENVCAGQCPMLEVKDSRFSAHDMARGPAAGQRDSGFLEQKVEDAYYLTDPRMTRILLDTRSRSALVVSSIEQMHGGRFLSPKFPACAWWIWRNTIAPGCEIETIGIRPGEKLHEVLISEDEARNALEVEDRYIIQPAHSFWHRRIG